MQPTSNAVSMFKDYFEGRSVTPRKTRFLSILYAAVLLSPVATVEAHAVTPVNNLAGKCDLESNESLVYLDPGS